MLKPNTPKHLHTLFMLLVDKCTFTQIIFQTKQTNENELIQIH